MMSRHTRVQICMCDSVLIVSIKPGDFLPLVDKNKHLCTGNG